MQYRKAKVETAGKDYNLMRVASREVSGSGLNGSGLLEPFQQ